MVIFTQKEYDYILSQFKYVENDDDINNEFVKAIYWNIGYWFWVDAYMDTAEELGQYINDEQYCKLYEKIMHGEE